MQEIRKHRDALPNILPTLGPAMSFVLFSDFNLAKDATVTEKDWDRECSSLVSNGLAGVASRVIADRSLSVPAGTMKRLQDAEFDDMTRTAVAVERSQLGIDSLVSADIPFVVIKGPGIARASASLSDRPFMDLDVFVAPPNFEQARRALASIGYEEHAATRPTWDVFTRFCREGINLCTTSGGSIDLHHRVSPWLWSRGLTFELLHRGARVSEVFGVPLPLASLEHNLLVAALHVVSDKSRPGQTYRIWRDLLVLTRHCSDDSILHAASQTDLCGWLAWILRCLPEAVRPTALVSELEAQEASIPSHRRLQMLLPPRFGSRHQLGQIFRLPVLHASLFTAGMVVPSPGYLQLLYPESRHRYLAWWGSVPRKFVQEARDRFDTSPAVDGGE
jgi:Uncharacterised nucleotidyltransferase